jgi:hypothetical protein
MAKGQETFRYLRRGVAPTARERASLKYNLSRVLDLPALAALAARMNTPVGSRTMG